jgi:hypothetical protein
MEGMQTLNGLILVVVVIVAIVAVVYFWPRIRGGDSGRQERVPVPAPRPPRADDPDQVDEATQVVAAVGGEVRPGDAATIHIADPQPWGLPGFDLDVSIAGVSRADIRDSTGVFSFMVYWMPADQEASIVSVEGDVPSLSEVFVGRLDSRQALAAALEWCRDQYLADVSSNERDFDLDEHGLGIWTAYSARDGGTLLLEHGSAPLLPAGAGMASGLPYRDCTFFRGSRDEPSRLRLVQVGTYAYAFIGEVTRLGAVSFLRRTPERSK